MLPEAIEHTLPAMVQALQSLLERIMLVWRK